MKHTTRMNRRGIAIAEMLALIPIVGATFTIVYQISVNAVRLESEASRMLAADALREDLVRRMREDAGGARGASLEDAPSATTLTLEAVRPASMPAEDDAAETQPTAGGTASAPQTVRYRIEGSRVSRIARNPAGVEITQHWSFESGTKIRCNLETINGKPAIAWFSFNDQHARYNRAEPTIRRTIAAAVTVGRGGVR